MKVLKTLTTGRLGSGTDERYAFGPFRLDCGTRELRRGDQLVALTPKAFDLLRVLVTSGGRSVKKNQLMTLVWPDSFVGEDSLTQNIATLRKALGDTPDQPQYIVTVPRHGYRFAAAVQALSDQSDVREGDSGARGASGSDDDAAAHASQSRERSTARSGCSSLLESSRGGERTGRPRIRNPLSPIVSMF